MGKRRKVSNLMALALLALLMPGHPMHPYQMATLLRRTGKDRDMRIKWGSLYTVVQNLEKHGFIEATTSDRSGRRPERTAYQITPAGRAELRDWVRDLVAEPEAEFPRFEAALSVLGVIPPDELVPLLEQRVRALDAIIAGQREMIASAGDLARVFLIEVEYALAMSQAEAAWVRGLLREIVDGSMSGLDQWREFHRTGVAPPDFIALLEGDPTTD